MAIMRAASSSATGLLGSETGRSTARNEAGRVAWSEAGRPQGSPLHIPYGYIYYVGSRRRVQVKFTTELRQKTRATIAQALKVAALETAPPPLSGKLVARCPPCSLLPLCLPEEVRLLRGEAAQS